MYLLRYHAVTSDNTSLVSPIHLFLFPIHKLEIYDNMMYSVTTT